MNKILKFFLILAFLSGFLAVGGSASGVEWGTPDCGLLVILGGALSMLVAGLIAIETQ